MKLLGASALAAALTVSVLVDVPARAAEPGYFASVQVGCQGGRGVISLQQEQVDEDTMRVLISGGSVPNGIWTGSYSTESAREQAKKLKVRAVDHSFEIELDVAGAADAHVLVELSNRDDSCAVGYADDPEGVAVASSAAFLVTRFPAPGTIRVRTVAPCDERGRWDVEVLAGYPDDTVVSATTVRCSHGLLRFRRTFGGEDGITQERPAAVQLVLDGPGGHIQKLSWNILRPS